MAVFLLVVIVPVLSKTMVSTLANCSTTNAFFKYNFRLPKILNTFPNVNGAVNANAQGQATIKIDTTTFVINAASTKNQ